MRNTKLINLTAIFVALLLTLFAAGYFLKAKKDESLRQSAAQKTATMKAATDNTTASDDTQDNPLMSLAAAASAANDQTNTSGMNETLQVLDIIIRLLLAVILAGVLAFRPRKNVPLFRRNLYVAQTQILLSVVAAALMMIVGDNTARAFAIFAAVSLVRFRTNIRDPKEITVLLISLALGLAAGVGRWELGLVLCLFALVLLIVLEVNEPAHVFRSMQLTIKTRDPETTAGLLKAIFDRNKLETEVRKILPPDGKSEFSSIMYYLNLPLSLSTDDLSNGILESDPENIEGIEWDQKKSAANIYQ